MNQKRSFAGIDLRPLPFFCLISFGLTSCFPPPNSPSDILNQTHIHKLTNAPEKTQKSLKSNFKKTNKLSSPLPPIFKKNGVYNFYKLNNFEPSRYPNGVIVREKGLYAAKQYIKGKDIKEGVLNNLELYFDNEPARHKLLDVIGDLALIPGNRLDLLADCLVGDDQDLVRLQTAGGRCQPGGLKNALDLVLRHGFGWVHLLRCVTPFELFDQFGKAARCMVCREQSLFGELALQFDDARHR